MSEEEFQLPLDQDLEHKIAQAFYKLCDPTPCNDVTELKQDVLDHVVTVQDALRSNEFLDIDCAKKIAHVLLQLLASYNEFSREDKRLINGAARYFIRLQDLEPDTQSILGFDDDLKVLNYVLRKVGKPEWVVES